MTFKELHIIDPILKALHAEGYETPTPIQAKAIPSLLHGKDLLGVAQTGTGKTAAFAIPIIQQLYLQKNNGQKQTKNIKALILTPTRELAIQINESFLSYGKQCGLKSLVIFGGVPQGAQVNALKTGIDILVATPGRLLDLMNQGFVHLQHINMFVLDEADRMLDMGFITDIKKIIPRLPVKRQTLFFSATMPPVIQNFADTLLHKPEKVEVTPVSSTADTIQQSVYFVDTKEKKYLLIHLLRDPKITSALVFTRTKHGADKVCTELAKVKIHAAAIHGNKSQNNRQRALSGFKDGSIHVLVATDIAARGIDVDGLSHVFNFDLPNVPETYVHRIGRTGRAGLNGCAISFCDLEEVEYLRDINKLIKKQIPIIEDHAYPLEEKVDLEHGHYPTRVSGGGNRRANNNGSQNGAKKQAGKQKTGGDVTKKPKRRDQHKRRR
jgi:ATP-dependent RNA helicase RhlE